MFGLGRNLSVRAERIHLQGTRKPVWKTLLFSEGDADAWRIVEASSTDGRPFELELTWSAANGSGASAKVTVAHASRICVFCRTVHVRAKNLDAADNTVGVTVADGYAETRNQFEVVGGPVDVEDETSELNDNPLKVKIPPFARRFTIETPEETSSGYIYTIDGSGRRRSRIQLAKQPDQGIWVGGARELELWLGPQPFRIVFDLGV